MALSCEPLFVIKYGPKRHKSTAILHSEGSLRVFDTVLRCQTPLKIFLSLPTSGYPYPQVCWQFNFFCNAYPLHKGA